MGEIGELAAASAVGERPGRAGFRARFATWLVEDGARAYSIPLLIDGFCRFLNSEGYGVFRCNLATDTVHPQMTGMRHVWFMQAADPGPINPAVVVERRQYRVGEAMIDEVFFNAGSQQSPQYIASPFYVVEQEGELYAPIRPLGEAQSFPVFEDLAQAGCTCYYGTRLSSFAGMLQKIGIASRVPDGLGPDEVEKLRWALSMLTLHLNTLIEYSVKNTLARVYLGKDSGARVCSGMISLGQVIALEGAIWFSDLRGFTEASDRLTPEDLIHTLNEYMAVVVDAIYANQGEVLKYIGDAVLAVFPTSQLGGPAPACRSALAAATAAAAGLASVNAGRAARAQPPLQQGVGLHYGETRYGNIGTLARLDFTVIGRAVNIASRLEGMTKELKTPMLCSGAFVEAAGVEMKHLGDFPVRGIHDDVSIFTPG